MSRCAIGTLDAAEKGRLAVPRILGKISDLADIVCLQKPSRPHELVQAVNAALAGRR
jgi:endonuclease/exonuclease/phosphatase family metal-dependent hydrolase